MERRTFVKSLAAGIAAIPFLPELSAAVSEQLHSLAADFQAAGTDRGRWQRVRQEFLLNPGLVHLNCGSIGATPRLVIDALSAHLRQFEGDPVNYAFGAAEDVGARAAAFLGAAREEIAVTRNTTEGMNNVATGLQLKSGDEILTTSHEHGGGMLCWQYLARRAGVRMAYIDMPAPVHSADQILQLLEDHLTPRTRVCSFSHVETITGLVMPLARIAALTRPKDILLVCDGAQAPGMLDVDVKALGVDTYASSSHKWILAPKGSGLLYVRKEIQDRVQPLFAYSGYGQAAYSASGGTQSVATILGHGLAMEFHNALGRPQVEARCRQLSDYLRQRLLRIPGLRLLTPSQPELSSGIVTFALEKGKNSEIADRLFRERDIRVKVVPPTYAYIPPSEAKPRDYNALRFSTHIFNSEDELDRLGDILGEMLKS